MIDNIINKYQKKFLIAYSGGLDSTVLLYKLLKIKKKQPDLQIRAIYINHNINISSKEWEKHCKKTCKINKIPLIIENIYLDKKKNNIEEKLRIKRYNSFYNHLYQDEILLTGHHMNDQCETFILSLKRGSGPSGLSAMSFETLFGNKKIVRPLLYFTKTQLKLWANNHNLNWIEDSSNFNVQYERNFIRHQVIPILEKKWPFFLKNCFRTAYICQKETKLLKTLLNEKIHSFLKHDHSLNVSIFKQLKKELATALIRHWLLLKKIKMPSYKNIQCIYIQTILSRKDSNPRIILKTNEIRRYKKSLYLIPTEPSLKKTLFFWHNINQQITFPGNIGYLVKHKNGITLPAPKYNELINIRFQYEGDILILGRNKKTKIKKIWQEKNVPPWLRDKIPLLFYNNIFIGALGIFFADIKNPNQITWSIAWVNNFKSYSKSCFFFT